MVVVHAADIQEYVKEQGVAFTADSVSRVMRDLRQRGAIAYRVVRRSESLYQSLPLFREVTP